MSIILSRCLWAGVITLLCLIGCHPQHKEAKQQNKFLVTTPIRRDTSFIREYVCQIRSIRHIELRSQVTGFLQETFVDEGQLVQEGQPLFKIMPNLYAAEYQKAKAETDFAQIKYDNTKMLADSTVVSPQELALAKAELEKAKATLLLAQTHLSFTDIRAPFRGLVGRFMTRKGSLLEEGELMTTLSDNSEMWVYYNVPEAEYLNYKARMQSDAFEVKLVMANNEPFKHPGVVKVIEAEFNNETGNVAFRASFPNPEGLLRHGETGKVQKTLNLKNAMLIPQKATFEILDKKYIYVVDKDNTLRSRRITVSAEMPDLYVVTEGLKDGEKILLEGLRLVKEGDTIQYSMQAPEHIMKQLRLHAE
jgi:membrane fusion protein, multidrug efflux system